MDNQAAQTAKIVVDSLNLPVTLVTQDQISAIAPNAIALRLSALLPYINQAMINFAINSKIRKAHFLAQIAHESDAFNTNEEYASGEDYEGRGDLGNTQAGDGVRFKGRGLIQITGRTNYAECGKALAVDLISNPKRLADYDLAALSAGWFWDCHSLNEIADDPNLSTTDTCIQITKIINGGENGLSARLDYLNRALSVL